MKPKSIPNPNPNVQDVAKPTWAHPNVRDVAKPAWAHPNVLDVAKPAWAPTLAAKPTEECKTESAGRIRSLKIFASGCRTNRHWV